MKTSVLRIERVRALERIGEALGIDFNAIPRQPDEEHLQLAILKLIDCKLERGDLMTAEQFIDEIEDVPGIGIGTVATIREALNG